MVPLTFISPVNTNVRCSLECRPPLAEIRPVGITVRRRICLLAPSRSGASHAASRECQDRCVARAVLACGACASRFTSPAPSSPIDSWLPAVPPSSAAASLHRCCFFPLPPFTPLPLTHTHTHSPLRVVVSLFLFLSRVHQHCRTPPVSPALVASLRPVKTPLPTKKKKSGGTKEPPPPQPPPSPTSFTAPHPLASVPRALPPPASGPPFFSSPFPKRHIRHREKPPLWA